MALKNRLKPLLIKIAKSSKGPKLRSLLDGMDEIVNAEVGSQYRADMSDRLSVAKLTNQDNVVQIGLNHSTNKKMNDNSIGKSKIKVRFFHCNENTFNVIQTVYDAFLQDDRFELLIVLFGGSYSGLIQQMEDGGYPYIVDYDYDIEKDKPDISIVYHLEIYYPPALQNIWKKTNYMVVVPLGVGQMWYGNRARTIRRMNLAKFHPDLFFLSKICYESLKKVIGEDKAVQVAPAQFDLSYHLLNKKSLYYPTGWEKLKNKKVVMYMSDHGLRPNTISDEVSFDLYCKTLFDFAKNNQDCGLIIRLHFSLIKELLSTFWSLDDYRKIVDYCTKSKNIVWDESDNYLTGLSIANACLIDVNCSVSFFSLAANKPIGIPLRFDMPVQVNNPDLINSYYIIKSTKDCENFLLEVKDGIDSSKTTRQKAFEEFIETYDGQNGQRIKDIIVKRYFESQKI